MPNISHHAVLEIKRGILQIRKEFLQTEILKGNLNQVTGMGSFVEYCQKNRKALEMF